MVENSSETWQDTYLNEMKSFKGDDSIAVYLLFSPTEWRKVHP